MAIVKTCCCGCPLSHGTFATGIVTIVEMLLYLVCGTLLVIRFQSEEIKIEKLRTTDRKTTSEPDNYIIQDYGGKVLQLGIFLIVEGSVGILASISLLCGVKSQRRPLLLPWLILRGIYMAVDFFMCVMSLAKGYNYLLAGGNLLFLALMVYLYIVVISFYQTRMEGSYTNGQVMVFASPSGLMPFLQQPVQGYRFSSPEAVALPPGWLPQFLPQMTQYPAPAQPPPPNYAPSQQHQEQQPFPYRTPQPLPPIAYTNSENRNR